MDDDVAIFDCIEFNPALRWIDVAADLAFLVMDLARLAQEESSASLVSAYRDAGGDAGDDALLYFYASYRAWVRAKVTCLRVAELPENDPRREREQHDARTLFELGHRFAWRARLPVVIVVCGVAASGKTALAARLSAQSGLQHLNSDVVRKGLAGLAPTQRASPEHYTRGVHAPDVRGAWPACGLGGRAAGRCHRRRDLPPRGPSAGLHGGIRGIVGADAVRRVSGAVGGAP